MVSDNIRKPFYLTYLLIAINVIIFIFVKFQDPSLSTETLVKYGAKISYKIADGQWYRLFTSMFLHADTNHLLFNMVALLQLGVETEMIFGKRKFLAIYFVSGLIGSIATFLINPSVGVGASGAIFGLMGANIYLYTLNPEAYKRIFGFSTIAVVLINFVYGFLTPKISMSAHIGGLIGGFICAWAVGYKFQSGFTWKNRLAQGAILLLVPLGLYLGYFRTVNSSDYYIYKGYFTVQEGDVNGAEAIFKAGQAKYPEVTEFKTYLDSIATYKQQLNLNK